MKKKIQGIPKRQRRIPKSIKPILDEVKEKLKKIYGDKLKGIILYGSYARGDFTDGSDIDIVILLEGMENQCKEALRCSRELYELELNYDTVISVLPVTVDYFETRHPPVILNAKREGIWI